MRCAVCRHSMPYDDTELGALKRHSAELRKQVELIEAYNDEQMGLDWRQRGPFRSAAVYRIEIDRVAGEIDRIENHVECRRFPRFEKRRMADRCGEYAESSSP